MKFTPLKTELFPLAGGLDLVSPALALKPGNLIAANNYEPDINGGYRRMFGYERFDGRQAPSSADYWVMTVTITGTIAVGNTVTGAISSATGKVLQVNANQLIINRMTGTFGVESIKVGVTVVGTVSTTAINAGDTPTLHAQYKSMTANDYRASIAKVPGSGPVRGCWYYGGLLYAFRDNAANPATSCDLYKSSASGWVQVPYGKEIQFTNAVGEIFEGDTVTGGTSGATGVVRRALLRTGTWAASGVGTLVFDTITGAFTSGEALKVSTVTKATSSTASTQIAMAPGGRFEFETNNFAGTTATRRVYGCDGKNYGFEFDGTRLVPIRTGIADDKPTHLAVWKNMLVYAVKSSVQVSGIGQPFSWTAITGAAEIALGDDCTGLLPQLGDASNGAIVITTLHKTFILYGSSIADFVLTVHSPDAGAMPYTQQNIGFAYFLDTKGVVQLNSTRSFGNFELSTLTRVVQPIIDDKRGLANASCIVRATNQYRIFYSDGTGLILYMIPDQSMNSGVSTDRVGAIMPFSFAEGVYMNAVYSQVDDNSVERIFGAGSDGYVYELDRGTSHDGASILSHFMLAFNSSKSPRNRKRYKRTILQATCKNTASVHIGYELNFGTNESLSGYRAFQELFGAGSYFDIFTWDKFNWDSPYVSEYIVDTPGMGRNIGILVYGDSAIDEPYTVHSAIMHYTIGRLER